MRPVLKPALRRMWRDRSTVQLGLDPGRALVLAGFDERAGRVLDLLDGTRDRDGVLDAAVPYGLGREQTTALLTVLGDAGALDDAATTSSALATLPRDHRERLRPDLASLSLLAGSPGGAFGVLERRRAAAVVVVGLGRVGAPLAGLLCAAGVGRVLVEDDRVATGDDVSPAGLQPAAVGHPRAEAVRAGLTPPAGPPSLRPGEKPALVVLADAGQPDPDRLDALVRDGVAHLIATVRETTGVIGPLVLPGRTSCLRCHDLHRSARDPAWPVLAAQLSTPSRATGAACDVALATLVAACAALQVLAFLDGVPEPACLDGTLEVALPDWRLRRRSWSAHPRCGCGWALDASLPGG